MAVTVTIDISEDSVFDEVLNVTNYLGAKDKVDSSSYETIATSRKNDEMLTRFFTSAMSVVTDVLRPYITGIDYTNGFKATLSMPSNWNSSLATDLKNSVFNYFVQYITAQWVRLVKDQELVANTHEDKWNEDAIGSLSQIKRKIYDRVRPSKPTYTDDTATSGSTGSGSGTSGTTIQVPSGSGISQVIGGDRTDISLVQ